jgi:hypothetical protein
MFQVRVQFTADVLGHAPPPRRPSDGFVHVNIPGGGGTRD